jgi:hypothetical protein
MRLLCEAGQEAIVCSVEAAHDQETQSPQANDNTTRAALTVHNRFLERPKLSAIPLGRGGIGISAAIGLGVPLSYSSSARHLGGSEMRARFSVQSSQFLFALQ